MENVAQRVAKRNWEKRIRKQVKLLESERLHVGIDAHKSSYSVALWSADRDILITTWRQPADIAILCRKLDRFRKNVVHVVYEASFCGYTLVRKLREAGFKADVIAPSRTLRETSKRPKTDRLDCRKLAMHDSKSLLHAVYVPTVQEDADRQIVRLREQDKRKLSKVKQQIKSFLMYSGIAQPAGLKYWAKYGVQTLYEMELPVELRFFLDELLEEYKFLTKRLKPVTRKVTQIARSDRHKADVHRWRTIPSVSMLTAMAFRAEMMELQRFNNGREIGMILGLAPQIESSGERRREEHIIKTGNHRIRTLLVVTAWKWIRFDPLAQETFLRLYANTRSKKKAIVAMARKLAIIMWRMGTRKESYRKVA